MSRLQPPSVPTSPPRKKRRCWSGPDRLAALRLAAEVGVAEAARRLDVPAGTLKAWRYLQRHGARPVPPGSPEQLQLPRVATTTAAPAPAEVVRQPPRGCARCQWTGRVVAGRGRRIVCPDCGDRRTLAVRLVPLEEWVEGLRRAADLGLDGYSTHEPRGLRRAADLGLDGYSTHEPRGRR